MTKRRLESLGSFAEEAISDMLRQPPCITETAYHLFTHKGVEVQLVLQRDSFSKIKGKQLFDKGKLK